MRVGVDIDGVLYPFVDQFAKWLGVHPLPVDRWEFFLDWGLTAEAFVGECGKAVDGGHLFRAGDPMPGAFDLLWDLREDGHEVILVTARNFGKPGASETATREWLDEHKMAYDELHFAEDKTQFNLDWHLDDSPDVVLSFNGTPTNCVVLDAPYNSHIGGRRVLTLDGYRQMIKAGAGETRVTNATTGGEKGSKLARYDLLPAEPLRQVAEHYGRGAAKYADRNWERGYDWSLSFAALQRHAWQFWGGEDLDPETRSHHMAAVVFHALALMEFSAAHPELDDRPKATQ